MTNVFEKVMDIVGRVERLGSRTLQNGSRLIGHVPHVAPEAYLHTTYRPLDGSEIASIEESIRRRVPEELKEFYRRSNGMKLFSDALSLDGLRFTYERSGDNARQPYSIITPNIIERPANADDTLVFFGGYMWDGSLLAMTPDSPVVYRCAPRSVEVLNEWPSFDEMLIGEVNRLSMLFDENGRKFDEDARTTP